MDGAPALGSKWGKSLLKGAYIRNTFNREVEVDSMANISIYLAGSIKKGDIDTKKTSYWTAAEEAKIIDCFGVDYSVRILNPATFAIKRSDSFGNFGGDMYLVHESDFIVVDARDKKGLGIGAEMVAAKYYHLPVVCLCPYDSYYKKRFLPNVYGEDIHNWTHPFITGLSDYIAETIEDAVKWMKEHLSVPKPIKGLSVIDESIAYFVETQLRDS